MPSIFRGKIFLVTGASRGVGRALALALARDGAHVVALARTQGALEELDDAIRAEGGSASLVPADLSKPDALEELAPALAKRFGRLDGLVLAAAHLGDLSPVAHLATGDWTRLVAVNLTANLRLLRALEPLMRAAGGGVVLALSDRRLAEPTPFWGPYLATKAALETLLATYALESARSGIGVAIARLPALATRLRGQAMPGEDASRLAAPESVVPALRDLLASPPAPPDILRSL